MIKIDRPEDKVNLMRTVGALRLETKKLLSLSYVGIDSPSPIYLNEQLTKTNYEIFKAAHEVSSNSPSKEDGQ